MENLTISLPNSLKEFVDAQVSAGGFAGPEDYIHRLLLDLQKHKAREKIEALLDEAMASGEPTEWTKQDLENVKREIVERHARRHGLSQ